MTEYGDATYFLIDHESGDVDKMSMTDKIWRKIPNNIREGIVHGDVIVEMNKDDGSIAYAIKSMDGTLYPDETHRYLWSTATKVGDVGLESSETTRISKYSLSGPSRGPPTTIGKYEVLSVLGTGSYGTVYLVEFEGERYAIKKLLIKDPEDLVSLIEIDLEMRIKHPHIVRGIDVFRDERFLYFVQEVADMSLTQYLNKNKLNIQTKIRLIYELGTALHYLLSIGVIHCDIKPDNILVLNDRILLADMGISAYIDMNISVCATITHRAPEYIIDEVSQFVSKYDDYRKFYQGSQYHQKRTWAHGEVWSYGMVALDILYNRDGVVWNAGRDRMGFIDIVGKLATFSSPRSAQKYVISRLGKLPEDHLPMLRLVLQRMLTGRLDRRSKTFVEVLRSDIFLDHGC